MSSYLSTGCVEQLNTLLDAYPHDGAPGTVVGVVNNEGKVLYLKAVGVNNVDTGEPMKEDQVFWLASCTKMVTGLAAMHLVEQGKLDLDAPIGNLIPELANPDVVYESSPTFVHTHKASKPITLKMLLTHTAGFGYSIWSAHIHNWATANKKSLVDFNAEMFKMPLVHEPGDAFEYGINMDWAGIAVERASGMSLGDYCEKYIFGPLNLKSITFDISKRPDMQIRLHALHMYRQANGANKFVVEDHIEPVVNPTVPGGGGGLFSTAADYLQILSVLLNNGLSPSGVQILKPETLKLMFENHTANLLDPGALGSGSLDSVDISLERGSIPLLPGIPKGWGYSFLLNLEDIPGGRKSHSAQWIGLANLFWLADPTSGIGSIVFNNILPFGDPAFNKMTQDLETVLYTPGHIVKA